MLRTEGNTKSYTAWSTTNTFRITTMAEGQRQRLSGASYTPLSPGAPRVLWIRKGHEPHAPGTPIHLLLGPEQNKEIEKRRKLKRHRWLLCCEEEEEEEQESMQAAGGAVGRKELGASSRCQQQLPQAAAKRLLAHPAPLAAVARSRWVCRSSRPRRVVRLASPSTDSAWTASSRPRNVPA